MTTRQCTQCSKETNTGKYLCNACQVVRQQAFTKTKKGLTGQMIRTQRQSSKVRGHNPWEYYQLTN